MKKLSIFTKAELRELEALEIRGGTAQPMANVRCTNSAPGCGYSNDECLNTSQCECPITPAHATAWCSPFSAIVCGTTQYAGCTVQTGANCAAQVFNCG